MVRYLLPLIILGIALIQTNIGENPIIMMVIGFGLLIAMLATDKEIWRWL